MSEDKKHIKVLERAADDSIRGYFAQVIRTIEIWLSLKEEQVLDCEGVEDADVFDLGADGAPVSGLHIQMKELAKAVSAKGLRDVIANFIVGYVEQAGKDIRSKLVFVTTAPQAKQRTNRKERIDILKAWQGLASSADGMLVAQLRKALNKLCSKRIKDDARLRKAVRHLDETQGWYGFFLAVDWRFESDPFPVVRKRILERLAADHRTKERSVSAGMALLAALIDHVIRISTQPDPVDRRLTRAGFDAFLKKFDEDNPAIKRMNAWLFYVADEVTELRVRIMKLEGALGAQKSSDLERLFASTEESLSVQRQLLTIPGIGRLWVDRSVVTEVAAKSERHDVVVVGLPGVGKTGVLLGLVDAVKKQNRPVVWLDPASSKGPTLTDFAQTLGLHGTFIEVVEELGNRNGMLILDGLDRAREKDSREMIQHVLAAAQTTQARIVSSLRKFEHETDPDLAAALKKRGGIAVYVNPFDDTEIKQYAGQMPHVEQALELLSPEMRGLVHIPFNLRLLVEALGKGARADDFRTLSTQRGLIELYWRYRGLNENSELLERITRRMIQEKTLVVRRKDLASGNELRDLLRIGVLVHPPDRLGRIDDRRVAFSHDTIFDFAVDELVFAGEAPDEVARIIGGADLFALNLSRALTFTAERLWISDETRADFWKLALSLEAARARAPVRDQVLRVMLQTTSPRPVDIDWLMCRVEVGDIEANALLSRLIELDLSGA